MLDLQLAPSHTGLLTRRQSFFRTLVYVGALLQCLLLSTMSHTPVASKIRVKCVTYDPTAGPIVAGLACTNIDIGHHSSHTQGCGVSHMSQVIKLAEFAS